MIGTNVIKHHYLKKRVLQSPKYGKYHWCRLYAHKTWVKTFREYHILHVQSNTFLVADVFNDFRKIWLKVYGLNILHFLSAPGLAWEAALKETKVKLDVLADTDM